MRISPNTCDDSECTACNHAPDMHAVCSEDFDLLAYTVLCTCSDKPSGQSQGTHLMYEVGCIWHIDKMWGYSLHRCASLSTSITHKPPALTSTALCSPIFKYLTRVSSTGEEGRGFRPNPPTSLLNLQPLPHNMNKSHTYLFIWSCPPLFVRTELPPLTKFSRWNPVN